MQTLLADGNHLPDRRSNAPRRRRAYPPGPRRPWMPLDSVSVRCG
ncbi:hypothetical protein CSB93_0245 [Pseudomonas paraeruginosa]|uniref:Uncharacterized protein n=1 Tax=Pseudomonas paraeruginosa TaxID=2994495 RepID=A0A2R3J1D1_9PSED|nr:hypothetical protein CSB93_0245 [Pseudomonas paraeruginosa]AWE94098.1 hypothetical protein CSC28_5560 [Pseudomonas paraeruginosa]PTC33878.1 hypothetical protein CLJ1_5086 [Pseudomonas aeruginosa]